MGAQQLHEKRPRNSDGSGQDRSELEQCQTSNIKRAADANATTVTTHPQGRWPEEAHEKKAGANQGNSPSSIDCSKCKCNHCDYTSSGAVAFEETRGTNCSASKTQRCRKVQMQPRCDHVSLWPDTLKRHAQRQQVQIGQYPATETLQPRCSKCKSLNSANMPRHGRRRLHGQEIYINTCWSKITRCTHSETDL